MEPQVSRRDAEVMEGTRMKTNFYLLLGVSWISFITGIAFESIGTMATCEPFPWYTPILIIGALGGPFVCGFLAGRERG